MAFLGIEILEIGEDDDRFRDITSMSVQAHITNSEHYGDSFFTATFRHLSDERTVIGDRSRLTNQAVLEVLRLTGSLVQFFSAGEFAT